MELYAKPAITPIELQSIGRFLAALTVVPLDEPVEKAAIAIRQARKIKLPDAIIAATAVILNAVCLSNDTHLVTLDWPGFNVQTTRFCE
jgi:predicted nucleic acid-binding protein